MTGSSGGGGDLAVAWQTTTPRTYQVARLLGRAHCRWTRQQSAVQDTANTKVNTHPCEWRQGRQRTKQQPTSSTPAADQASKPFWPSPTPLVAVSNPTYSFHARHHLADTTQRTSPSRTRAACCSCVTISFSLCPPDVYVRSQQRGMGSLSRLVATHRCGEGTTSKHDSSCATSSLPAQRTNSSGVVGSAISVICGAEQQEVRTCSLRKASGATHLLIHPSVTWSGWRRRRVTGDRGIELRLTVRRGTSLVNSLPPAKGKQWA